MKGRRGWVKLGLVGVTSKLGFLLALLTAALVASLSAQTFSVVHHFTNWDEGIYPVGGLVVDANTLYGTTRVSVFRINTDGSGYSVLKHYTNSDAALLGMAGELELDGTNLFGIASQGGSNALGAIFRISTDGSSFTVLRDFAEVPDGSSSYYSGLALSGNILYGVTGSGGSNGFGTVFKINTDGSSYSILRHFEGSPDGAGPRGTLVLDGNTIYGETSNGGSNGPYAGTIFKLNTDGSGYTVLKHFGALDALGNYSKDDGVSPQGGLILRGDTLYGTTAAGGSNDFGTAFRINTNGTGFTILHHFVNLANPGSGSRPTSGVILVGDTLYGTTATIPGPDNGTVFNLKTDGSDYTIIKGFSDFANPAYSTNWDGASPQAGLVASGNALYGVASKGGLYLQGSSGLGTIYKLAMPEPLKILVNDSGFGVKSNAFGFNVSGNSNQTIVIEASTNLMVSGWLPLRTNILGATPFYFSDTNWANYSGRYYRVRSP